VGSSDEPFFDLTSLFAGLSFKPVVENVFGLGDT
jgi:hypothetical protein